MSGFDLAKSRWLKLAWMLAFASMTFKRAAPQVRHGRQAAIHASFSACDGEGARSPPAPRRMANCRAALRRARTPLDQSARQSPWPRARAAGASASALSAPAIYRPLINMVMSIVHRITGAALYFGTLLLAAWLVAAASEPRMLRLASTALFATWLGMIVLFGYTWALIHHMLGGMRHFIWDTGAALDIAAVDLLSWGSHRAVGAADGGAVVLHRHGTRMGDGMAMTHAARSRARPRLRQGGHRAISASSASPPSPTSSSLSFPIGLIAKLAGADHATVKRDAGEPADRHRARRC